MFSFISRIRKGGNPPTVEKKPNPIRFGIISAARIAPDAIVKPAKYHEEVTIVAVAARSLDKAKKFASDWSIPKAYGSYQELIDDPEIDAIYVATPNSLHYEWTLKSLAGGKHVLCEKPIADNEEEARIMFETAQARGLVLLEAWQPQFHPSMRRVKDIIKEGSFGPIKRMETHLAIWNSIFQKDDIRFAYDLGGGAMMDAGPYPISSMMYFSDAKPEVNSAKTVLRPGTDNIDRLMDTTLTFYRPDVENDKGIEAHILTDVALEGWGPFKLIPRWLKWKLRVEMENGAVEISDYVLPHLWHSIRVIPKSGAAWTEKAYKPNDGEPGEEWWSAYRYQLEYFVDKVRGRPAAHWRTAEESITEMATIDKMYQKAGLALRPTSTFKLPA